MNAAVYASCFRELEKSASLTSVIAQRAAGIGRGVTQVAKDVGNTAVHTFDPRAWRSGYRMMRAKGGWEPAIFGGSTALGAGMTLAMGTDPVTGAKTGPLERGLSAAAGVGSSLASYRIGGGLGRSMVVGMGAGLLTDRVARTVGRGGDRTVAMLRGTPTGAAPPARGVT